MGAWVAGVLLVALVGCSDTSEPAGPMASMPMDDHPELKTKKTKTVEDVPQGRHLTRMTADQFHASLEVVTGERWSEFEKYSGILGKPDYQEITEEGKELSVGFAKLVSDAARETCAAAVTKDREREATQRTILRHVTLSDDTPDAIRGNVRYLMLRFLGQKIPSNDDPRVDPWFELMTAPLPDLEASTDFDAQDINALRWTAVCVGLATHPDFVTY